MPQQKNPKSLANLIPFEPGRSGNPAGAPKGKRFKTVIRDLLEQEAVIGQDEVDRQLIELIETRYSRRLTNRELITLKQVLKAAQGDTGAFNALADREEGKPIQVQKALDAGGTYLEFLDEIAKESPDE